LAVAAILIVTIAGRTSQWTEIGALLWLGARIVYLPLYWAGIPVIRTLVWTVGLVGIGMVLWPALAG